MLFGFSLNGTEFTEFSEFRESTEAWIRINLTVFSVSCVRGTVVESLPLTQEIVGSSTAIFWKKLLFLSLNSAKTFRENSIKHWASFWTYVILLRTDRRTHALQKSYILVNTGLGAPTYYLAKFFLKTAWKWKKLDREGAGASLTSANAISNSSFGLSPFLFVFVWVLLKKWHFLLFLKIK